MKAAHHFPQLDGSATQAINCGVSATRSAISWATRRAVQPGVGETRRRMDDRKTPTDPRDWERAILSYDTPAELAGKYEAIPVAGRANGGAWRPVSRHLDRGGMALLAVDYGVFRALMPRRSGSRTFSGYHAIPFSLDGRGRLISRDPLLDGRYPGCPDGPVPVDRAKVEQAAMVIGRRELKRPAAWYCLVDRAVRVGAGVDPEPVPEDDDDPATLAGVLASLYEARDQATAARTVRQLAGAIAELQALIGPYTGPAAPDADPDAGARVDR